MRYNSYKDFLFILYYNSVYFDFKTLLVYE